MFKCIVDKKGRSTTELALDFVAVLRKAGYYINDFGNPKKTTGTLTEGSGRLNDYRIIANKGNKEFCFYISPYGAGEPLSDYQLDLAPVPPEDSTLLGVGTIAGCITTDAVVGNKVFIQESNTSSTNNVNVFSAAINRLNATDYSIYLSIDRKHILVITEINGFTTYLAFGDFLNKTNQEGQYIIGSFKSGGGYEEGFFIYKTNASGGTNKICSPLFVGDGNTGSVKMNTFINPEGITLKTSRIYNGFYEVGNLNCIYSEFNRFSGGNLQTFSIDNYRLLKEEASGKNLIRQVNLNFFFENNSSVYQSLNLGDFPFYLCHALSFNHREKIAIGNKRYQCLKFGNLNDKVANNRNLGYAMLIEVFE